MSRKALPFTLALSLAFLTFTTLLAAPLAAAQSTPTTWSKTYGGPGSDRASAMIRTHEGGYAMIGTTNSYGSGLISSWLVKTDVDGNILWNQTYSGLGQSIADALVQTDDGGYAATGYTYSLDQTSGAGTLSMWILRTDYLGNLLWNQTYDQVGTSIGYFIIQTSDGGFAVVGTSNSLVSGAKVAWLMKIDGNGVLQWDKVFSSSIDDEFYSLLQTSDGGYVMAGVTAPTNTTETQPWMVKTDSTGDSQWNQTYSVPGTCAVSTMVQTSDGGYALTGALQESAGDQFLMIKTDSSGNMQWYKNYSIVSSDDAYTGIQTSDGGYAMLGASKASTDSFYKVLLAKTSSDGTLQWSQIYGGDAVYVAGALVQNPDGGFTLAGYTNSTGAGREDFWLMKTDANGNSALSPSTSPSPSSSGATSTPDSGSSGGGWDFTTTLAIGVAVVVIIVVVGVFALRRQSSKSKYKKR